MSPTRFPRTPALAPALAAGALLAAGCTPYRYPYVRAPLEVPEDAALPAEVVVDVPLDWLRRHSEDMVPDRLVFYATGRHPLRHRLVDTDDDGTPDVARVAATVRDPHTQLTVVCAEAGDAVLDRREPLGPDRQPTPGARLRRDLSVRKR